ncbi:Nucleotidyl transferase AbiEii toxin, Type IV TA system [Quadrisphaera granulorum]|uniref:Nucleotidyltransferase AbiEii toxin of type IV toxin-antitoxin system n=1 Tax=Quadrisphaera granulorum TaxID=317664 RepID=A0A316A4K5_9ACTN|nr:nucleotidyl transferase AbiEii/AbiGii toxin family protein [Quadrisphaera granulorum]PWJ52831.1 nucleotidyltransferase AbiEii toxin of type IV toxin-antitoxin system [Quadrisphaera granulorum]SZE97436.1 Nucleotidyl transferase AbiEii toxin, Type IV TA system [Quadrisphaera granulorum]
MTEVVAAIAALPDPDGEGLDGISFDTASLKTRRIREEGLYAGVRVTLDAQLATAPLKVCLDVNTGDPITPGPQRVRLPSVRPGSPAVSVLGYPLETVLAEKLATAIELGEVNTRMKDYADVWTLTGRRSFTHATVRTALIATTSYRRTALVPLADRIAALATMRAAAFAAYGRSLGAAGSHLPARLDEVVADVVAFAAPLVSERQAGSTWMPASRSWS